MTTSPFLVTAGDDVPLPLPPTPRLPAVDTLPAITGVRLQDAVAGLDSLLDGPALSAPAAASAPLPAAPSAAVGAQHGSLADRQQEARVRLLAQPAWWDTATAAELIAAGVAEHDLRVMRYELFRDAVPHAARRDSDTLRRVFKRLHKAAGYARERTPDWLARAYELRAFYRQSGLEGEELDAIAPLPTEPPPPPTGLLESVEQRRERIRGLVERGEPLPTPHIPHGQRSPELMAQRRQLASDRALYRELLREHKAKQRADDRLDAEALRRFARLAEAGVPDARRQHRLLLARREAEADWGMRALQDLTHIERQGRSPAVAERHLQAGLPVWKRRHVCP